MSGVVPSELRVTDDAFLGDGLRVLQPKHGYRAGIDAVLLAATVAGDGALRVADLGAGAGVVGLCVARRLPAARVTLVEREAELVEIARQNAIRNGLSDRVAVVSGDVTGKAELLRLCGTEDELVRCRSRQPAVLCDRTGHRGGQCPEGCLARHGWRTARQLGAVCGAPNAARRNVHDDP